jgi:fibronectin type 3 domain-containing protein
MLSWTAALAVIVLSSCPNHILDTVKQDVQKAQHVGIPKLVLLQGAIPIQSENSYKFSVFQATPQNAKDTAVQLSITNAGDGDLTLTAAVPVALSQEGSAFSIKKAPPKTYAPNASQTFDLLFNPPDDVTECTVTVTIASNDPATPTFKFTVIGKGAKEDTSKPTVTFSPANEAADVDIHSSVVMTFSKPMAINQTIMSNAFKVKKGVSDVGGSCDVGTDYLTATFKPKNPLDPGTRYDISLDGSVPDTTSNTLYGIQTAYFTTLGVPGWSSCLPVPDDKADGLPLSITLSWTPADKAKVDGYDVYVWTGASAGATPTATVTSGTSCTLTTGITWATSYSWKVIAKNGSGTTSSPTWTFKTLAPPAGPALIGPSNASSGLDPAVTLSWNASPTATSYDVYCDTAASPKFYTNVKGTSVPFGGSYGTTYYWKVVARNDAGASLSSSTWSFSTLFVTILSAPADGAVNVAPPATLSWQAANGATSYDVYCDTSAGPATKIGTTTTATSLPFAGAPGTKYYWKVIAKKGAVTSPDSAIWSFTMLPGPGAPGLSSPASGATGLSLSVTLSWTAPTSGGAVVSYDVYCDSNPTPTTPVGNTTGTSMAFTKAAYNTSYNWRVVANNASGSMSSGIWTFTTVTPPGAPTLASPGDKATSQPVPVTLSWNAPTSGGAVASYDVYCDTGSATTWVGNTAGTSMSFSGSYSKTYSWKVVAKNAAGTGTSGTWTFATLTPPGAPTLSAPASGTTKVISPVTVSWTKPASGGAPDSYDVYCDTSTTPTTFVGNATGTSLSFSVSYAATYYWRVVAKNAAGSGSSSSAWWFATMVKPSAPALSGPTNGTKDQWATVTLSWTAPSSGDPVTYYDVFFDTTPKFGKPVASVSGGTLSLDVACAYGTTYYWAVGARNAAGSTAAATWAFVTVSPSALIAPVNGATGLNSTQTLAWGAVPNASGYYVYCDTNNPPKTLVYKGIATGYKFGGSYDTTYYWMVEAVNGKDSITSAVWSFSPLYRPVLVSPADGATGQASSVTLTWSGATGADSYSVYCDTSSTPTTLIGSTTSTSMTFNGSYNATYYWRVVSSNVSSKTALSSATWSFLTLSPPVAPVLSGPANGATGSPLLPKMVWVMVGGAASYDVYFGTSLKGMALYKNVTTNYAFAKATLLYSGTYYWSVIAKNAAGSSPVSATWSFTTRADTIIYPLDGAINIPYQVTEADWPDVKGASYYYCYASVNGGLTWVPSPKLPASGFFDPTLAKPPGTVIRWYFIAYDSSGKTVYDSRKTKPYYSFETGK